MSGRTRVVVTGLGLVTSLGIGRAENWASAVAGRSGAAPIAGFDTSDSATTIACEVRASTPRTSSSAAPPAAWTASRSSRWPRPASPWRTPTSR